MANRRKNNKTNENQQNTNLSKRKSWGDVLPGLLKYLLGITVPIIGVLFYFHTEFKWINESLNSINSKIAAQSAYIEETKKDISRLYDIVDRHEELLVKQESVIAELAGRITEISAGQPVYIKPTSAFTDVISIKKDMIQFLSAPKWESDTIIGSDLHSGEEYHPSDLINRIVVLSYKEDGQDVFFMGQFNERNHWEGECLINVYADGHFVISTKAIYHDGERIDYKQLFPTSDALCYAERHNIDSGSSGDTWKYENTAPIIQNISFDDPQADLMIEPETYIKSISSNCISHYHGNTENGSYEDDTDSAYLVAFFEDGSTRTVYKGRFKDGVFNDETGAAWYITMEKGDKRTPYMYFEGGFDSGKPSQNKRKIFINPMTKKEADAIIANQPFKDEIIWNEAGFE